MKAQAMRHILLVDSHTAVRHGLALVLTEEGIGEGREAAGREEGLAAAAREPPGVALVDLSIGADDAVQLVSELSALNIPVLVCSMHEEASYGRRALAAGARGYITKREAPWELARAVRDHPGGLDADQPARRRGLALR
jgi:DNA-binding NarL/FixJ family response regulator